MRLTLDSAAVATRLEATSLVFEPGALVALVGENGAGKSTLLDVAAGVLVPTSGRVTIDATDVAGMAPRDRASCIASLGQREPDVDDLVVEQRIALGLSARRGAFAPVNDDVLARLRAIAIELGVNSLLTRTVGSLSAGERRRVAVARALIDAEAGAVLLDEPHAAVDIARVASVTAALRSRARTGGIVLFSVHDVGVALDVDRVIGLRAGRVVFDGPPAQLNGDALAAIYGVRRVDVVRVGDP